MAFFAPNTSFLTNRRHFPTKGDIISQKEQVSGKYFPFFSQKYYLTLLKGTFSPIHTLVSLQRTSSHTKNATRALQDKTLFPHNGPLFPHTHVLFSQKYHLSLGQLDLFFPKYCMTIPNWTLATKKRTISPRNTTFPPYIGDFLHIR